MSKKPAKKTDRVKRLAVLFWVVGLLLAACMGRAIYLVTANGNEFRHKALAQATGTSTSIAAKPGSILDANGTYLAATKRVYRLILDPKVMAETDEANPGSLDKTAEILSETFSLDIDEVKKAFTENTDSSYLRFGGSSGTILEDEEVEAYKEAVSAFNSEKTTYNAKILAKEIEGTKITAKVSGVWFEEEYRREYPLGDTLSKVIGYTTEDMSEGILGLEKYYSDLIQGVDGKEYKYIDENGKVTTEVVEAEDGLTLQTSLDANVSAILKNAIVKFQEETGGHRINIIVMNPNNGEIIAMESDTEFDLNDPTDLSALFTEEELENPAETFLLQEAFKGRTEELEAMTKEEQLEALLQQVQLNYAVSGTYEPGSTAKALTLATGIEENIIDPEDTFFCDGTIEVEGYSIHCHMDDQCGYLTPMEALGRSCNVCYVQIGQKIGIETFTKYQEIFNLGQKTGIDLPAEANTKNLIYHEDSMQTIDLSTSSFGQSFNVSMIQLASAYASLINGGYYYEPHVVTSVLDSEGNTVEEIEPLLVRRTISEETSEYMREALEYVIEKGTAGYVKIDGYNLLGKTGASEKLPRSEQNYVVSFIGAAPADDPKFLIYATVDEPDVEDQSMSKPAQELVRYCLDDLYAYYGIFPETADDAYSYDWSQLRDSTDSSDAAKGKSFIDDPEGTLRWITDDENLLNRTENTDSEEEEPSQETEDTE